MPETPKITVCIPAYNRRALFRATLWSALRQTHRNIEVIVSDNASDEDLAAEVLAAGDPRVRYVRQPTNVGPLGNFAFLQTQGSGDYFLFLCSDDLLLPDCLATAGKVLDENPARGAAVYMAAHYDERGFKYASTMPAREFAGAEAFARDASVRDFRYTSPSLQLFRRAAFDRVGRMDPELVALGDWEIYARMIRHGGGVAFIHRVLAIVRLHDDRESNLRALHWDFYQDAMRLATRPEYSWGDAYRAMALVEQLLWDWRLRRSPRRTLAHARQTRAFPAVLPYLPLEILKRVEAKMARGFRRAHPPAQPCEAPSIPGIDALDAFWRAAEAIRTGVQL